MAGRLEVEEYGAGPPLVLVHGSPANGKTWRAVGELLSDRFRVMAPTLPGHEAPDDATPTPMTTADMAEAVESAIGAPDGPIRLAAHSFGAAIALRVALRGRVAIDRLILFEPVTMKILETAGEDAAYAIAESTFDEYIARHRRGEKRAVETMIAFWFGHGAFERMPAPVQDYLIARTEVNLRDVAASFAETYSKAELANLRIPATIVLGGASPAVTRTIAETTAAALGNATVAVIEGAGHGMLVSHPDEVAAMIGAPNEPMVP